MDKDRLCDYVNDNLHDFICDFVQTEEGQELLYEILQSNSKFEDLFYYSHEFEQYVYNEFINTEVARAESYADR